MDIFGRKAERREEERLVQAIERLTRVLERLISLIVPGPATGFTISQVSASTPTATGASQMGVINGVSAGASGVFVASPTPAGSLLSPSGPAPTWATDSPSDVTLVVSPDGLTCTASVSASSTLKSFGLTITGTSSSGASISGSASVPVLASAGQAATGFDISQTS